MRTLAGNNLSLPDESDNAWMYESEGTIKSEEESDITGEV